MSDPERRIGDLTVKIERDSCIGSGNCIKVAQSFFELDDESVVVFRDGQPPPDRAMVVEACQNCPVEALVVIDEKGNRIVP
jgi:ferredoxin